MNIQEICCQLSDQQFVKDICILQLVEEYSYRVVARFGMMHMIARNLCEWLYVVVEETKNDIFQVLNTTSTKHHPGE
jgi:hypothetical protein